MRTLQELILLSAIIPTLNEAARLPAALAALQSRVAEIVVSDGGSADETARIAAEAGGLVDRAPRGRRSQLLLGAAAASGDWLLFLHADCRLGAGWETAVRAFIAAPDAAGRAGYFGFALAGP